jgi:L-ribulose-5-phosphate 3-epimerase
MERIHIMDKNRNYELGLYEKAMPKNLTWEEKFVAAKEAGYDYIEMSIDETDEKLARLEWTKEERAELVALMHKHKIYLRSICLSGHRKYPLGSLELEARSLEISEKVMELADDLGIRIVMLAGYDVYYTESTKDTQERFLVNLKKTGEFAAKYGIMCGFETMETEFMNTVEKAMYYVNAVDSPYLNVYPDLGNITNAAVAKGYDVTEDIKTGTGRTIAVHLKETVPGVFREMEYGTGHVDFKTCIDLYKEMGVRRYVGEFWHLGEDNWREILKANNDFLRSYLD